MVKQDVVRWEICHHLGGPGGALHGQVEARHGGAELFQGIFHLLFHLSKLLCWHPRGKWHSSQRSAHLNFNELEVDSWLLLNPLRESGQVTPVWLVKPNQNYIIVCEKYLYKTNFSLILYWWYLSIWGLKKGANTSYAVGSGACRGRWPPVWESPITKVSTTLPQGSSTSTRVPPLSVQTLIIKHGKSYTWGKCCYEYCGLPIQRNTASLSQDIWILPFLHLVKGGPVNDQLHHFWLVFPLYCFLYLGEDCLKLVKIAAFVLLFP